jgi:hypothetical protein
MCFFVFFFAAAAAVLFSAPCMRWGLRDEKKIDSDNKKKNEDRVREKKKIYSVFVMNF